MSARGQAAPPVRLQAPAYPTTTRGRHAEPQEAVPSLQGGAVKRAAPERSQARAWNASPNARRAPERIINAHLTDERAWPTSAAGSAPGSCISYYDERASC